MIADRQSPDPRGRPLGRVVGRLSHAARSGNPAGSLALGIPIVPVGDYIAAYEDEMEPLKKYDAALFGGTPDEVPRAPAEQR